MTLLRRLFDFFVYSNLFIAGCAVLMASQTYQLVLHRDPNFDLLAFIFFSTICSYSFHWYLTTGSAIPSHRINWLRPNLFVHLIFFIIGIAGSAIFFFRLIDFWPWLALAAFITFLYSAPKIPHPLFRSLRKIAIGKTIFLAGVWTYVTTALPVLLTEEKQGGDFSLFLLSRFFLIYAICILFDYRDRLDDREKGIKSLITYMSEANIRLLFVGSLLVFAASTLALASFHYETIFILFLLLPGVITAALFNYARKNFTDILYYFVLDGLMALSSALTLMTRI